MIEKIQKDIVEAMRAKDSDKLTALRGLVSELKNAEIDLRAANKLLDEAESIKVLNREAKKRRESIEIFSKSKREDLASNERSKLAIIESYLPVQMSSEEVQKIIEDTIAGLEDKTFGSAMKAVMQKLQGKADGKMISDQIKKILV